MAIKFIALCFLLPCFPIIAEPVIIQRTIVTADIVVHENAETKINVSTPIKTTLNQTSTQSGSPLVTYHIHGGQHMLISIPNDMGQSPSYCAHIQGVKARSNQFKYCLIGHFMQRESIIYGKNYYRAPTKKPISIFRKDTDQQTPIDTYLPTIDVISYFK